MSVFDFVLYGEEQVGRPRPGEAVSIQHPRPDGAQDNGSTPVSPNQSPR